MPQNTAVGSLGTPLEFQNPATVALVLDSEVGGVDGVTGLPLTREIVITQESISGQSSDTTIIELLRQILVEAKGMRLIMEQETVPGLAEEIDEVGPDADEADTDESQGA
jgi:hypothetical protein